MTRRAASFVAHLLLVALVAAVSVLPAHASAPVLVRSAAELTRALAEAHDGATIRVAPGTYHVHLHITRSVRLLGKPGAVLDGDGSGDVVRIAAPGVVLRGFRIERSGADLTTMNAGVFVAKVAADVRIENNEFASVLFGIWLDGAGNARVIGNRIEGLPKLRSQDRGNGIHLHNVTGALIARNEVWETRDGIYIETSTHSTLRGNSLHDLRYGIHYMYSNRNDVIDNRTRDTRTGYALMQSNHLRVIGNRSAHDRNYGILMNYITYSEIARNAIDGISSGRAYVTGGADVPGAAGKAVFIYNSLYNSIHDNRFADSDIGVHLTAGSDHNLIYGNAFVHNRVQVRYAYERAEEWSHDGRGNYWSNYLGWDLNGDGIGDVPYVPNDAVDRLLWTYPAAHLLMNSPAVEILRWVQRAFPVLQPPGVRDSHPLMTPPPALAVAEAKP